jgi:hypothetical protein
MRRPPEDDQVWPFGVDRFGERCRLVVVNEDGGPFETGALQRATPRSAEDIPDVVRRGEIETGKADDELAELAECSDGDHLVGLIEMTGTPVHARLAGWRAVNRHDNLLHVRYLLAREASNRS